MTAQPEMPEPGSIGWSPPQEPKAATGAYRMSVTRVTSMLVVTRQRRVVVTGTLEQIESAYREALTHNLLLGWWGIPFGLIWTPIALTKNRKNMKTIRQLAAQNASAPAGIAEQ